MSILTNKAIAKIFRQFADKIENGTCDVDEETLSDIANNLIHIKLNAKQVAKYINVSRATVSRMVADGRLPHPHKTAGEDKYWYRDEIDEHIAKYKAKYGLD